VLLDRGYKGPPQSVAAIERSEAASNGYDPVVINV